MRMWSASAFSGKRTAQTGKALLSIENERPADDFDLWAFTISWEMDYFNVVELLRQAKIPPLAADRQSSAMGWTPLAPADCVRSGVTMNPEPVAPIFDAILIGEAKRQCHS